MFNHAQLSLKRVSLIKHYQTYLFMTYKFVFIYIGQNVLKSNIKCQNIKKPYSYTHSFLSIYN